MRSFLIGVGMALAASSLPAQEAQIGTESSAAAGVVVRQAKPGESDAVSKEIPSPMLLEISLGATAKRKSLFDHDKTPLVSTETADYSCDKARVRVVQAWHRRRGGGLVEIKIIPTLSTDYYRQDIDLTVALVSDGKVVREQTWKSFTIGRDSVASGFWVTGASHSKSPEAVFDDITEKDFAAMFKDGKAPVARIIVAID